MQLRAVRTRWPQVRLAGVVLGTALAAFWLRGPILQVGGLALGAAASYAGSGAGKKRTRKRRARK